MRTAGMKTAVLRGGRFSLTYSGMRRYNMEKKRAKVDEEWKES